MIVLLVWGALLQAGPPATQQPAQEPEAKQEAPPPQEAPLPPIEPDQSPLFASVRTGAWWLGEFDAVTTNGTRRVTREVMGGAGLDVGVVYEPVRLFLSGDYAALKDANVILGGVHVGADLPLLDEEEYSPSLDLRGSVGLVFGQYEVEMEGFGDFEAAVGFVSRVALGAQFPKGLEISVWGELRVIEFEYEDDVVSGDESIGGSTLAAGVALGIRF